MTHCNARCEGQTPEPVLLLEGHAPGTRPLRTLKPINYSSICMRSQFAVMNNMLRESMLFRPAHSVAPVRKGCYQSGHVLFCSSGDNNKDKAITKEDKEKENMNMNYKINDNE